MFIRDFRFMKRIHICSVLNWPKFPKIEPYFAGNFVSWGRGQNDGGPKSPGTPAWCEREDKTRLAGGNLTDCIILL